MLVNSSLSVNGSAVLGCEAAATSSWHPAVKGFWTATWDWIPLQLRPQNHSHVHCEVHTGRVSCNKMRMIEIQDRKYAKRKQEILCMHRGKTFGTVAHLIWLKITLLSWKNLLKFALLFLNRCVIFTTADYLNQSHQWLVTESDKRCLFCHCLWRQNKSGRKSITKKKRKEKHAAVCKITALISLSP